VYVANALSGGKQKPKRRKTLAILVMPSKIRFYAKKAVETFAAQQCLCRHPNMASRKAKGRKRSPKLSEEGIL